jgi:cation diffusion facilitator family transporter
MADCCENKGCAIDAMKIKQSKTLKIVLLINICLFVLTATFGLVANSASLLTESLDDLGDAITYALSLYVVYKSDKAKAKVALFKGLLILVGALFVLSQVISHVINQSVPLFETMGMVAVVALLGNLTCLYLLTKHREQDINMSSVWECSKNDILNNLAVIAAAVIVWITNVGWADVLVGFVLSVLLIKSSIKVIKSALAHM